MKARQAEAAMSKMMAIKSGDAALDDVASTIVQDAYKTSSFSTPAYKEKAIREFENKWFAACLQAKGA